MTRILFLAANPRDTTSLKLDEEIRAIDEGLRRAAFRDAFDIRQHWAVRVTDIQECLLRHRPHIVHFSGHGSKSSEIILEDAWGDGCPVSVRALGSLFATLRDDIRCVVLNACYSEQQAQAIAAHVECVIGMSRAMSDLAAISFVSSFYQALGYGRSVKTAFDLGCAQVDIEGLGEQNTPKLLARHRDADTVFFASEQDQRASSEPGKRTESRIRLKRAGAAGRRALLESNSPLITMGRGPRNMVRVSDPSVSWEHGQIILMLGAYFYRHLSRTNPSIVCRRGEEFLLEAGIREEIQLRSQDRLTLGNTTFVVEFDLIDEDADYKETEASRA